MQEAKEICDFLDKQSLELNSKKIIYFVHSQSFGFIENYFDKQLNEKGASVTGSLIEDIRLKSKVNGMTYKQ